MNVVSLLLFPSHQFPRLSWQLFVILPVSSQACVLCAHTPHTITLTRLCGSCSHHLVDPGDCGADSTSVCRGPYRPLPPPPAGCLVFLISIPSQEYIQVHLTIVEVFNSRVTGGLSEQLDTWYMHSESPCHYLLSPCPSSEAAFSCP